MGARIAVAALIDDEGLAEPLHVDLVGAEEIDDFDFAGTGGVEHGPDVETAFARDEAEIEAADARGRRMQHIEAIPGRFRLDRADGDGRLGGERKHRRAVGPRDSAPCPRISIGRSAPSSVLRKG